MKIFMTGGTGFIGSHVVVELLRQGHHLTLLARNPNKIPALHKLNGVELMEGDLTDLDLLSQLVRNQDACIHLALNYKRAAGTDILLDDTLPAAHLAEAAASAGVSRFILTSSTAVNDSLYAGIDDAPQGGVPQEATATTKQRPATVYGAAKAAAENFAMATSFNSSMQVNIIRPGYTFGNPALPGGPIQGDDRFERIVRCALRGGTHRCGEQRWNTVYLRFRSCFVIRRGSGQFQKS